jgi:hypothetical protein
MKYPLHRPCTISGIIFDKRITWDFGIGMIKKKAFRTLITVYSLFKSEQLNANIKLTL